MVWSIKQAHNTRALKGALVMFPLVPRNIVAVCVFCSPQLHLIHCFALNHLQTLLLLFPFFAVHIALHVHCKNIWLRCRGEGRGIPVPVKCASVRDSIYFKTPVYRTPGHSSPLHTTRVPTARPEANGADRRLTLLPCLLRHVRCVCVRACVRACVRVLRARVRACLAVAEFCETLPIPL